jgi:chaperone required for assembly of F1-ATPase
MDIRLLFFDYLIRWVLRLIDISGTAYLAGITTMAVSKNHQRLGDIAAGTAVISLKNNINISHTILEQLSEDYQPVFAEVIRFSDNDIRIIKETYQNAIKNNDLKTVKKLIEKMETVSGIKQGALSDSRFISTIIKDYNYYTGK